MKLALDLDAVLGDTRPLWEAWLEDASRRFRSIAELDAKALPYDRVAAAHELDRWAERGIGDWRASLVRFAEDHAPVYLRPQAPVSAALRLLDGAGAQIGVFTDAPVELAMFALVHLGAARRIEAIGDSPERLRAVLGGEVVIVRSADDLTRLAL